MNSAPREKTLSISNLKAAVEEWIHRNCPGELQDNEGIELPWKVQQIPIVIKRVKEVRVFHKRSNGKS